MTDRDRRICETRGCGVEVKAIASAFNLTSQSIERIIYSPEGKELVESVKMERNSRAFLTPGERLQRLMVQVVDSLEHEMDLAADPASKVKLLSRIQEASKVIPLPADSDSEGELPIVVLPERLSVQEFNARTLAETPLSPSAQTPEIGALTPGGSEMSGRSQLAENEVPVPYPTDEELLDAFT